MKLLAFLFSFYVLLLPALPCSDERECKPDTTASVSPAACQEQHQHSEEGCTPFCSCACCGQVFAPSGKQDKIGYNKPRQQQNTTFYVQSPLYSNYLDNIWQPPRLG